MERLLYLVAYLVALGLVTIGGNLLAQRIYPTTYDDEGSRPFAYRFVFIACAGGIALLLLGLVQVLGL